MVALKKLFEKLKTYLLDKYQSIKSIIIFGSAINDLKLNSDIDVYVMWDSDEDWETFTIDGQRFELFFEPKDSFLNQAENSYEIKSRLRNAKVIFEENNLGRILLDKVNQPLIVRKRVIKTMLDKEYSLLEKISDDLSNLISKNNLMSANYLLRWLVDKFIVFYGQMENVYGLDVPKDKNALLNKLRNHSLIMSDLCDIFYEVNSSNELDYQRVLSRLLLIKQKMVDRYVH
ncbi:MAG: nucleotidyltransferase domain-containing protein [Candidatus Odinarchaeia archaeon]